MTTALKKPYHHGDLRRALIVAGIELLAEGGAAALDLRKVARKAGVSHAAPYRHFEDKRALLAAIAEEGFVRLTEQLKRVPTTLSPEEVLSGLIHTYVNFALTEPALMREMFSGLTIDRMEYPDLHASSKIGLGLLIEVIERGQAAGTFVGGDSVKQALVLWAMFHGLAMLLLENQMPMVTAEPGGVDDMIQSCVASLYNGFRPR